MRRSDIRRVPLSAHTFYGHQSDRVAYMWEKQLKVPADAGPRRRGPRTVRVVMHVVCHPPAREDERVLSRGLFEPIVRAARQSKIGPFADPAALDTTTPAIADQLAPSFVRVARTVQRGVTCQSDLISGEIVDSAVSPASWPEDGGEIYLIHDAPASVATPRPATSVNDVDLFPGPDYLQYVGMTEQRGSFLRPLSHVKSSPKSLFSRQIMRRATEMEGDTLELYCHMTHISNDLLNLTEQVFVSRLGSSFLEGGGNVGLGGFTQTSTARDWLFLAAKAAVESVHPASLPARRWVESLLDCPATFIPRIAHGGVGGGTTREHRSQHNIATLSLRLGENMFIRDWVGQAAADELRLGDMQSLSVATRAQPMDFSWRAGSACASRQFPLAPFLNRPATVVDRPAASVAVERRPTASTAAVDTRLAASTSTVDTRLAASTSTVDTRLAASTSTVEKRPAASTGTPPRPKHGPMTVERLTALAKLKAEKRRAAERALAEAGLDAPRACRPQTPEWPSTPSEPATPTTPS